MTINGVAVAAAGAGALLLYAGITGKDIPGAVQAVISGRPPSTAAQKYGIAGTASATGSGPGGGGSPGSVSASSSERSYFSAVLGDLRAPANGPNLSDMYRWAKKEEPTFPPPTPWQNNPLNIKNSQTGQFQSWATPTAGAMGTAGFMLANNYSAIVASLRSGRGIVDSPEVAAELLAWSGGGYSSVH